MIIAMNVFPKNKRFFEMCILIFLIGVLINVSYSVFEKLRYAEPVYRVEAFWGHYQFYANFLIIAFFIELFYFIFVQNKTFKVFVFLLLIFTFFSLVLTASRAQIAFTLLGLFGFVVVYRNRFFIISGILILIVLIISFLKIPVFYKRIKPMFLHERKKGIYITNVREWKERVDTWKKGFEVMRTKYRFFGVGLGNARKFIIEKMGMDMQLPNLHNSFLEVLVSLGIFGLAVFLYFLFVYFYEIYKSICFFKNSKLFYYGVSIFISSFIIFILVGFLNDTFWNKRIMMELLYFTGILFAFKRNENTVSI